MIGNIGFQSVFHLGGVCFQCGSQRIHQDIALIEVFGCIQLVGIGVALSTVLQSQRIQQISTGSLVDAIQHLNMVGGDSIRVRFRELDDIGNLQVSKLHTGNGIAVALTAVAKIGLFVIITCADGFPWPVKILEAEQQEKRPCSCGETVLVNGDPMVLDKKRIGKYEGTLKDSQMNAVMEAFRKKMGWPEDYDPAGEVEAP